MAIKDKLQEIWRSAPYYVITAAAIGLAYWIGVVEKVSIVPFYEDAKPIQTEMWGIKIEKENFGPTNLMFFAQVSAEKDFNSLIVGGFGKPKYGMQPGTEFELTLGNGELRLEQIDITRPSSNYPSGPVIEV